jgi:NADH:ubiquinone oxidoreductase subunit K
MGYHGILGCFHSSIISMLWVIMVHGVAVFKWGVMVSLLISCELLLCAFNVKVRSLN